MRKSDLKWVLLIIVVITTISQTSVIEGNIDNELVDQEDINEYSYRTDYITIEAETYPRDGADLSDGHTRLDAIGEKVGFDFYLGNAVDPDPNMSAVLTIVFLRIDANDDTITMWEGIWSYVTTGASTNTVILNAETTWPDSGADTFHKQQITITSGLFADRLLRGYFQMNEAAREIKILSISLNYHIKRNV